jgi:glycosyltransferase involved in cell wall biosynthesis
VIVGDAPYATEYKRGLRELAASDRGVVFTGFQFGDAYRELRTNCLAYVQATEVGGTHPALVEAMAYGNAIIANRVPEHEEVLGEAGLYYAKNNFDELASLLRQVVTQSDIRAQLKVLATQRARERYSWDTITDRYENVFLRLNQGKCG